MTPGRLGWMKLMFRRNYHSYKSQGDSIAGVGRQCAVARGGALACVFSATMVVAIRRIRLWRRSRPSKESKPYPVNYEAEIDGQPGCNRGVGWKANPCARCDAVRFSFCRFLFRKALMNRGFTTPEMKIILRFFTFSQSSGSSTEVELSWCLEPVEKRDQRAC